jgi:hypothetical protein
VWPEILKENIGKKVPFLPLHWVVLIQRPLQVVQLIYGKYPEAIKNTAHGRSLLECAISHGWGIHFGGGPFREDVICFLISKNPDLQTKKNIMDQFPVHSLCHDMMQDVQSQETLDDMLLDCPKTLWVGAEEEGGSSALNICMREGSSNLADMLQSTIIQYAREMKSKASMRIL